MGILSSIFGRNRDSVIEKEFQRRIWSPEIEIVGSTSDNILVWKFYGETMQSTDSFQIRGQINPNYYMPLYDGMTRVNIPNYFTPYDNKKLQLKLLDHFCRDFMEVKWPAMRYVTWPDGNKVLTRVENEYDWNGFTCWLRDSCMAKKVSI